MLGPAQAAVVRAVVDSVESGVISKEKANDCRSRADGAAPMRAARPTHTCFPEGVSDGDEVSKFSRA
jgi:hypothetical protein